MQDLNSFYSLTPEVVLDAIESCGYVTTGGYLQLNSYENRVFDIFLETSSKDYEDLSGHLIAKFYRPQRWSRAALLEEHFFELELLSEASICASHPRRKFGDSSQSPRFEFFDLQEMSRPYADELCESRQVRKEATVARRSHVLWGAWPLVAWILGTIEIRIGF